MYSSLPLNLSGPAWIKIYHYQAKERKFTGLNTQEDITEMQRH